MTDFDENGATPSGCRRYLAGQDEDASDSIDDAVAIRNDEAERLANVHVTYQYYENVEANSWGKTFQQMCDEVDSGDPNTPDIFTNYTYDMVITSLKSTFNNLNNTKLDTKNGGNYFSFLKDGYNEEVNNRGYMYSYMTTLSLSDEKMYVLASDYFIDCVRAFIIVPVHIGLLETVGMEITGDLDEDGVRQRILPGSMPSTSTRYAYLYASTRVLPEPAPAIILTLPSVAFTASSCLSFNPLSSI